MAVLPQWSWSDSAINKLQEIVSSGLRVAPWWRDTRPRAHPGSNVTKERCEYGKHGTRRTHRATRADTNAAACAEELQVPADAGGAAALVARAGAPGTRPQLLARHDAARWAPARDAAVGRLGGWRALLRRSPHDPMGAQPEAESR